MHTVIHLPTFLSDAKAAGVTVRELETMTVTVAKNPEAGDVIPGTGGARKLRIAAKGKGKSGGFRVIYYFGAVDVPVFFLALVDKGERADISQAERNELRDYLSTLADEYREGVKRKVRGLRP